MALDPELRAFLEAMEQRIDQRAAARDAETRQVLRAEIKATRAVAEAALSVAVQARDAASAARAETRQGFEAASREARMLHEDTWEKIEGMKAGLSTHERAEADRLDAAREEAMLTQHVLPLEASATATAAGLTRHQQRINDHDTRIQAVENR